MIVKRTARQMAHLLAGGLFGTLLAGSAWADEQQEVMDAITGLVGGRAAIGKIEVSPMGGVYQVQIGNDVSYAIREGKHLLLGNVFDLERKASLSEEWKQARAAEVVDAISEDDMIIYANDEPKRTITVYTDVDCGYCQKLHKEVPQLVDSGVKVRYLWYPRSGPNTKSFQKAESVWCADDQLAAMDDAKLRQKFTDKTCENPVLAQYESGKKVGVRGTPTIVVDDGTLIGGYVPYKRLLAQLGLEEAAKEAKAE